MSPLSLPQRHVTLRSVLLVCAGIVLLLCFLGYTGYQARFLLAGPQVSVSTSEATSIHTERIVEVAGVAQNITRMSLNGRQIYTDETGHFAEAIVLENGYTTATLRAEDRYGRTTVVSRSFIYVPQTPEEPTEEMALSNIQ